MIVCACSLFWEGGGGGGGMCFFIRSFLPSFFLSFWKSTRHVKLLPWNWISSFSHSVRTGVTGNTNHQFSMSPGQPFYGDSVLRFWVRVSVLFSSTKTKCNYLNGWIKKRSHAQNVTQDGESQRYYWGTQKKKKKRKRKKKKRKK